MLAQGASDADCGPVNSDSSARQSDGGGREKRKRGAVQYDEVKRRAKRAARGHGYMDRGGRAVMAGSRSAGQTVGAVVTSTVG